MCTLHQIDTNKMESFGERLLDMINGAAITVMISIGHRTGLFDTMSVMQPATSAEIAKKAGLDERYVREWLGAMTTGSITQCSNDTGEPRYFLPMEHSALLTRAAGADNFGVFAQYIPLTGTVEDEVIDKFYNGGGVPYSSFKRFHEVMAEDSGLSVLTSLSESILPLIPGLTEKLKSGIRVMDLGCGRGRALNSLAEAYPNSTFYGCDLSEEAIEFARAESRAKGLANIKFYATDLTTFDIDAPENEYDFITTFDAIHDQARPDRVLRGIYRALKPDGTYLMQDIGASSDVRNNMEIPLAPLLYTVSTMHCMTVSLAQGGMGLGTMWGKELALDMLKKAGFRNVDVHQLEHDIQNYYYVVSK